MLFAPFRLGVLGVAWIATFTCYRYAQAQVKVVNIMPKELSWEKNHNAEPFVAVNPLNHQEIYASAEMFDNSYCQRDEIDVLFRSLDGGATWQISCMLPVSTNDPRSGDITLGFGRDGGNLYAGYLSPLTVFGSGGTMRVARADAAQRSGNLPMTQILAIDLIDQPQVAVVSQDGHDRVYVGSSDKGSHPNFGQAMVAVLESADLMPASGTYTKQYVNTRGPSLDPAVRPTGRADGAVLALYYRNRGSMCTTIPPLCKLDVVVAGTLPFASLFTALNEPKRAGGLCAARDGKPGIRIKHCEPVPQKNDNQAGFGWERFAQSAIAIATDPRPGKVLTTYVAWASGTGTSDYTLHLRRSHDGGVSWGLDRRVIPRATNPALAIAADGTVGLLYQQLIDYCFGQRWVTKLELSRNSFGTKPQTYILARTLAETPTPQGLPYLGDYASLRAEGTVFYGVFTASNFPDQLNFPEGVTYARNVDWAAQHLLTEDGSQEVAVSLDPFFFSLDATEAFSCASVRDMIRKMAPVKRGGAKSPGVCRQLSKSRPYAKTDDLRSAWSSYLAHSDC